MQVSREDVKLRVKKVLQRSNMEVTRGSRLRAIVGLATRLNVATLIDVGANEGQFARLFRHAGFTGSIVSYEPMRSASSRALRHARNDNNWSVVRAALGSEAGSSLINVSENSYSSSLLNIRPRHVNAAPQSAVTHSEEIEVRRLDSELARLAIDPRVSMLKVDTQGFEREVLAGGGELATRFQLLQVEMSIVELYKGSPTFDELYGDLSRSGWRLWSLEPGFTAGDGEMLQCDGVFVRRQAPE